MQTKSSVFGGPSASLEVTYTGKPVSGKLASRSQIVANQYSKISLFAR